jgi:peptidyl-prolyl cis-trans isomerase B (cyclophilin B)
MKKFLFASLILLLNQQFLTAQQDIAIGKISTRFGDIYVELHDETPRHKESFIQLANAGYWDSLTFNRVIPNFVAQGGCPDTEDGFNDPEYLLEPEFDKKLTHIYGALGAGRDDNPQKLSATCQFYIVQNKDGLHRLDGNYTVFGQVIKGMGIVDQLVVQERNPSNAPLDPIDLLISIIWMDADSFQLMKNSGKHP